VLELCERHAAALLTLLVAVGAALRLIYFGRRWISADEGVNWQGATGVAHDAAALIQVHTTPPFMYQLLGWIHAAGGGIDAMRFPSLLAGIALPAVLFLVARRSAGNAAGVLTALLVVNVPGVLELSQVMRPYALLSVALGLGTLFLFRFLDDGAPRDALAWGLCWVVALGLHYCSFVVLGGTVLYVGGLFASARLDSRRAWGLALVLSLLAVVVLWSYLSHIQPSLQGSARQVTAQQSWLASQFTQSPLELLRNVYRAAGFLFGWVFAPFACLLVPAAIWLAPVPAGRRPALLTVTTLAVALVLSFLGQYPLGGTRHSFYLLVFAAPGVGAALAALLATPRLAAVGLVSLAAAASSLLFHPGPGSELPVKRVDALALREALRAETAPGDLILTDIQTYRIILPLLSNPGFLEGAPDFGGLNRFQAEGRRYVVADEWRLDIRGEQDELHDMLLRLDREPGDEWDLHGRRMWLVRAGSGAPTCDQLREGWPDRVDTRAWSFDRRRVMACRLVPEAFLSR
jgi:hypothetical protein